MKDAEGAKNKLQLSSVKKNLYLQSMSTIRWATGQSHIADTLTKGSQDISKLADAFLNCGHHSYPSPSYVTESDIFGP